MAITLNRVGAVDGATNPSALFVTKYFNAVYTSFKDSLDFMKHSQIKVITNAKSATFSYIGNLTASEHTAGSQITGQAMNRNKREILVDRMQVSAIWIDEEDLAMLETDEATKYSMEMGYALGRKANVLVAQEAIKGARASNPVTGLDGGSQVKSDKLKLDTGNAANAQTVEEKAKAWYAAILATKTVLDQKNVFNTRYLGLTYADFNDLQNYTDLLNKDFQGSGNIATGELPRVAGFYLMPTNLLPQTDTTSDTVHGVDATKTVGIAFTDESVAVVQLIGIKMEVNWHDDYIAWLYQARHAMGYGWLRPETLVELALDTTTVA